MIDRKNISRADIFQGHFGHIEEIQSAIGQMLVSIITDWGQLLEINVSPNNGLKVKQRCNYLPRSGDLRYWTAADREHTARVIWKKFDPVKA